MAYKNKLIHNPVTGQSIRFINTAADTSGQLLEMESFYNACSKEPVAHYHPYQKEDFTVISGELTVRINGELKVLKAGDKLHVAEGVVHSMWNNSATKTVVSWKVTPALDTEFFLENAMGLATDGKTNASGMPGILQIALFADKYSKTFRLAKPPFKVQVVLFSLLKPFAYAKGLKSSYDKYLN